MSSRIKSKRWLTRGIQSNMSNKNNYTHTFIYAIYWRIVQKKVVKSNLVEKNKEAIFPIIC